MRTEVAFTLTLALCVSGCAESGTATPNSDTIQDVFERLPKMTAEEKEEELGRLVSWIESKQPEESDTQLATMIAGALEMDSPDAAGQAYNRFADLLEKQDQIPAAERFRAAGRRMLMIGREFVLKGTTTDGAPFDIESLRGKVVLIDFWATWCPPCRAEYPNMKQHYERYHDRGFEVVGVSGDRDRDDLLRYLKSKQVPWITLHESRGESNPAESRYGILTYPTMILLDREGKVISLWARGERLGRLLAEQFDG